MFFHKFLKILNIQNILENFIHVYPHSAVKRLHKYKFKNMKKQILIKKTGFPSSFHKNHKVGRRNIVLPFPFTSEFTLKRKLNMVINKSKSSYSLLVNSFLPCIRGRSCPFVFGRKKLFQIL